MIERLDSDLVEEWKRHPVTLALIEDLRIEREQMRERFENLAANANEYCAPLIANGARAAQLRDIVALIKNAKGKTGE